VIRVGTCAWSDHEDFYPAGLPKPAQIGYYARYFPLVEVDSSFYRPPSARNCALWTERTPPAFRFHVKAYRTLTWHDREAIPDGPALAALARQFAEAVEPMRAAGKLSALHFQFPPWFQARDPERDYLRELRQAMPDHVLAVEFRHRSWFAAPEATAATLELLRAYGFVHTVVDQPQVGSGSVPFVPAATSRALALVRLHGRNAATWYKRTETTGERFKYRYALEELAGFVQPVRALAAQAADVHVLTNNNYQDSAVRNAAELARLLALGYADPWAEAPLTGA
jgi:uncharacterized protein YecE (DUF72 family)